MLTDDEAEILASVSIKVSRLYGSSATCLDVESIRSRYASLLAEKERRAAA